MRDEFAKRRRLILDRIVRILDGVPWVEGGCYSWLQGPQGEYLTLDLFFPDVPLAVDVCPEEQGDWVQVKDKVDRQVWEYLKAQESAKVLMLGRLNVPYLFVRWDDPSSELWLERRIRELIQVRRS